MVSLLIERDMIKGLPWSSFTDHSFSATALIARFLLCLPLKKLSEQRFVAAVSHGNEGSHARRKRQQLSLSWAVILL